MKTTVKQLLIDEGKVAVSCAQARRMVSSGAVTVNGEKATSLDQEHTLNAPLHVRVGKRIEFTIDEKEPKDGNSTESN